LGVSPSTAKAAEQLNIEYHPLIRGCKGVLSADEISFIKFCPTYPGSRWFIYNEPDESSQTDCQYGVIYADGNRFEQAVDRYYASTQAILTVDPTAQFGCCGELYGRTA